MKKKEKKKDNKKYDRGKSQMADGKWKREKHVQQTPRKYCKYSMASEIPTINTQVCSSIPLAFCLR
jgi:hypothetical protein